MTRSKPTFSNIGSLTRNVAKPSSATSRLFSELLKSHPLIWQKAENTPRHVALEKLAAARAANYEPVLTLQFDGSLLFSLRPRNTR